MNSLAPGCFGVPSIFSFTSRICGDCKHGQACQGASYASLLAMPDSITVRTLRAQHDKRLPLDASPAARGKPNRAELTPDQDAKIAGMPKKAGDYLRKLLVRCKDIEIRKCAYDGTNPFRKEGARPWFIAFECLLEGGFTKAGLRAAFVDELGWSESAAFSQVSIIWNVFPALEIAEENGCSLVPTPGVLCKNGRVKGYGD